MYVCTSKKCTKKRDARAELLFWSLNLLFLTLSSSLWLEGYPYLPWKRSAWDYLPTRDNFPLSCVTSNLDNLNGIIQFLS